MLVDKMCFSALSIFSLSLSFSLEKLGSFGWRKPSGGEGREGNLKRRLLWRMMCKRDTPLMFNFLQTPVLIHLHQGQGKVLTEVFMRRAESENTL